MPKPALTLPEVRVTLADETEHTVQTITADAIRWDMTRAKHGWPATKEAPFMWMAFLAWHALRRTGAIDDAVTWEAFSGSVLNVTAAGESDVDPTPPAVTLE